MSRVERRPNIRPIAQTRVQSQEYHNYQTGTFNSHYQPVRVGGHTPTPISNKQPVVQNGLEMGTLSIRRTGAHLLNGKLYATKSGYLINNHGMVVNMNTGEAISLAMAERNGLVRRLADEDDRTDSYVPAANMMFNRVRAVTGAQFSNPPPRASYPITSLFVLVCRAFHRIGL